MGNPPNIMVRFCFERLWLSGFCYATGLKRTEVLYRVRRAIIEACNEVTSCYFKVSFDAGARPSNQQWFAWSEHKSLEAPLGCSVRRLGRVAKDAMAREMRRLSEQRPKEES